MEFVDDTTLGKWRKCVLACQMAFYNAKYLFSISPGRPDSVRNCSQIERSSRSLAVRCDPGFDGGLEQLFTLELRPWRPDDHSALSRRNRDPLNDKGMNAKTTAFCEDIIIRVCSVFVPVLVCIVFALHRVNPRSEAFGL